MNEILDKFYTSTSPENGEMLIFAFPESMSININKKNLVVKTGNITLGDNLLALLNTRIGWKAGLILYADPIVQT